MQEIYSNNSKVLIDTQNSSNVLYLPLDQLKNRNTSTGATTDSTTGKTLSPAEIDVLSNQLEEKIRNNKQSSGRADSTRNREAR